jgi:hypothetical protein
MKTLAAATLQTTIISVIFSATVQAKPPAPAGRAATCAAIEKETQKFVTDALKAGEFELSAKDFIEAIFPLGACIEPAVGGGQWALVLNEAPRFSTEDVTPPDASFNDEGEYQDAPEPVSATLASIRNWTPIFVTSEGTRIALEGDPMLPFFEAYLNASAVSVPVPWQHQKREVTGMVRSLPEGVAGAAFKNWGESMVLVRFDGKRVVIDPASKVLPSPTDLIDVDGDGVEDLVDSVSLRPPAPDGMHIPAPFDLVAKGLPNGGFDVHAPSVLGKYRTECEGMGRSPWMLARRVMHARAATNIFCGLLFGVPRATVKAALSREAKAAEDPTEMAFYEDVALFSSLLEAIDSDLPRFVTRTDGFRVLDVSSASAVSAMTSFGVYDFGAAQAVDGDRGTSWQPKKAKDAWLELKLRGPEPVAALEFANGFQRFDKLGDLFAMNSRPTKMTVALGGKTFDLTLDPTSQGLQRLDLPEVVTTDTIRITVRAWKKGSRWDHVAISEVVPLAR